MNVYHFLMGRNCEVPALFLYFHSQNLRISINNSNFAHYTYIFLTITRHKEQWHTETLP